MRSREPAQERVSLRTVEMSRAQTASKIVRNYPQVKVDLRQQIDPEVIVVEEEPVREKPRPKVVSQPIAPASERNFFS